VARERTHMMVAIAAAMPEELAPLRARLDRTRTFRAGRREVVEGWLAGRAVMLASTGDGARNAAEGARALLASGAVGCLVVVGVAGALSAGLAPGALVIAEQVVDAAGWALRADAALAGAAAAATGACPGTVVTARRIAETPAEKRRLLVESAAGASAAVVDLESAVYVAAAAAARVPWLVLRAVSDGADEALPALLNRARDDGGAVSRLHVLAALATSPRTLPHLLSLRTRVRHCATILATAVESLLRTR